MKNLKALFFAFGLFMNKRCVSENVEVTYHGFNSNTNNNKVGDLAKEESKNGYYAPEYDHEQYSYPAYRFEYGVHDPHTGDIKKQYEERDGDSVRGYYSLMEPDGSIRLVEYTADSKNGFQAVVKKIGHSNHPTTVTHHLNNGPEHGGGGGGYAPHYHGQNYQQQPAHYEHNTSPQHYQPQPTQYEPAPQQHYEPAPQQHYEPAPQQHYEPAHYESPPQHHHYEPPVAPPTYHHQVPAVHPTYYHPPAGINYGGGGSYGDYDSGYAGYGYGGDAPTPHGDYGSASPEQYHSLPLRFPAAPEPATPASEDNFEWPPSADAAQDYRYSGDSGSDEVSPKNQKYERPEYLRKYFEQDYEGPGSYFDESE
ncbi:homeotic protein deformed-like [Adelges cooleyi]|uniref:homeotic protein deformed-like n=1 Tax=Adelges cooleyi TaxID=133065 RepID=UPI00218011C5|nr:homeotic protein deformed-like [Adelges cooleyi]